MKISGAQWVRTFKNFSATQLLREIKIANFRDPKSAILAIFEVLDFDIWGNSRFWKCWNFPKPLNFGLLKRLKLKFLTFLIVKFDFMQNLSGRKILKYPQCVFPIRLSKFVCASRHELWKLSINQFILDFSWNIYHSEMSLKYYVSRIFANISYLKCFSHQLPRHGIC